MRRKPITLAVLTRLHFEPGDHNWEQRLAIFRTITLPCILSQTVKDFTYYVICCSDHVDQVASLSPKIIPLPWPVFPKAIGPRHNYDDLIPPYNLQASIDYDDWISVDYIKKLRQTSRLCDRQQVITFVPTKLDLLNLTCYKMKEVYGDTKASPFYSLYTPNLSNYQNIYNFNHYRVPKKLAPVKLIKPGYCHLVIHQLNWISRITPNCGITNCKGDI
jgi:hypothetical protein